MRGHGEIVNMQYKRQYKNKLQKISNPFRSVAYASFAYG